MAVEQLVSSLGEERHAADGPLLAGQGLLWRCLRWRRRTGTLAPLRSLRAASRAGQEPALRHFPQPREPRHTTLHWPLFAGQCPEAVYFDTIINPGLGHAGGDSYHTLPDPHPWQ